MKGGDEMKSKSKPQIRGHADPARTSAGFFISASLQDIGNKIVSKYKH